MTDFGKRARAMIGAASSYETGYAVKEAIRILAEGLDALERREVGDRCEHCPTTDYLNDTNWHSMMCGHCGRVQHRTAPLVEPTPPPAEVATTKGTVEHAFWCYLDNTLPEQQRPTQTPGFEFIQAFGQLALDHEALQRENAELREVLAEFRKLAPSLQPWQVNERIPGWQYISRLIEKADRILQPKEPGNG